MELQHARCAGGDFFGGLDRGAGPHVDGVAWPAKLGKAQLAERRHVLEPRHALRWPKALEEAGHAQVVGQVRRKQAADPLHVTARVTQPIN